MKVVTLDAYVIDTLLPDLVGHDHSPSAFLVWLVLWRAAHQGDGKTASLSLRAISESCGLSKRAVQNAISRLKRRRLIHVEQETSTAIPVYTPLRPWSRR